MFRARLSIVHSPLAAILNVVSDSKVFLAMTFGGLY